MANGQWDVSQTWLARGTRFRLHKLLICLCMVSEDWFHNILDVDYLAVYPGCLHPQHSNGWVSRYTSPQAHPMAEYPLNTTHGMTALGLSWEAILHTNSTVHGRVSQYTSSPAYPTEVISQEPPGQLARTNVQYALKGRPLIYSASLDMPPSLTPIPTHSQGSIDCDVHYIEQVDGQKTTATRKNIFRQNKYLYTSDYTGGSQ